MSSRKGSNKDMVYEEQEQKSSRRMARHSIFDQLGEHVDMIIQAKPLIEPANEPPPNIGPQPLPPPPQVRNGVIPRINTTH
jgi:hypothetical protein